MKSEDLDIFISWLNQRPAWIISSINTMLETGKQPNPSEIEELVKLCINEPKTPIKIDSAKFKTHFATDSNTAKLILKNISDIKGINALNPKEPLEFNSDKINIIYGGNGSGKSGYARILKQACGARKIDNLLGNVYSGRANQECKFKICNDGVDIQIDWQPKKGIEKQLKTIDIYDSSCALSYVINENEVSYEPSILRFLTYLSDLCSQLAEKIKQRQDLIKPLKPFLEQHIAETKIGRLVLNLTSRSNIPKELQSTKWNPAKKRKLEALEKTLLNSNNDVLINAIDSKVNSVTKLKGEIKKIEKMLSTVEFKKTLKVKVKVKKKKQQIQKAEEILKGQNFKGIGDDVWLKLWEAAKDFSERYAYPNYEYPNVNDGAKCVLCQQDLDKASKERFVGLEEFTKGKLYQELDVLEEELQSLFDDLPRIWNNDMIEHLATTIGFDEKEKFIITGLFNFFKQRIDIFKNSNRLEELSKIDSKESSKLVLRKEGKLNKERRDLEKAASLTGKAEIGAEINNLKSEKWIADNKKFVISYLGALVQVSILNDAKIRTNSVSFTTKKAELAESLISKQFIKNFEDEIHKLGAGHLKIKIEKSKSQKGKIYYNIKLKDAVINEKIENILSEGEFRVVSLAAFLADVANKEFNSPFIFDDPISSLDIDFEEATVKRLVELSKAKQVIVFTHRLSFFCLLNDEAKAQGIEPNNITLTSEVWGTGNPIKPQVSTQKPDKAINSLLDRLTQANKILNEKGKQEYESVAKSICSDFRILIERIVEEVLLNQIVLRYRRSIMTKDKMDVLIKINRDDVDVMEYMMTEYSKFEHSQSRELPNKFIEPASIKSDLEKIKKWMEEFKTRAS